MSVKTLRASGSYVQADVVIGCNKYGSDVTVSVKLSRTDPTVQQVMAPLVEFFVAYAKDHVTSAADEAEMQKAVEERLARLLEPEKQRVRKNLMVGLEAQNERLMRESQQVKGELERLRGQITDLRATNAHLQHRLSSA